MNAKRDPRMTLSYVERELVHNLRELPFTQRRAVMRLVRGFVLHEWDLEAAQQAVKAARSKKRRWRDGK
jgi:hypothetical protein